MSYICVDDFPFTNTSTLKHLQENNNEINRDFLCRFSSFLLLVFLYNRKTLPSSTVLRTPSDLATQLLRFVVPTCGLPPSLLSFYYTSFVKTSHTQPSDGRLTSTVVTFNKIPYTNPVCLSFLRFSDSEPVGFSYHPSCLHPTLLTLRELFLQTGLKLYREPDLGFVTSNVPGSIRRPFIQKMKSESGVFPKEPPSDALPETIGNLEKLLVDGI